MGEVVYLSSRRPQASDMDDMDFDIDLLTAVDVALRDLADISSHVSIEAAREQAQVCRDMLKHAFEAALHER